MAEVLGLPTPSLTDSSNGVLRFANFEVDPRSGELRREGLKIKLHGQPFEVLLTLLTSQGQVVTRESLREKLWSGDTFVDFEPGLNKAINRLREALGDDANHPRFIETLPRRGYRFLVEVLPHAPEMPLHPSAKMESSKLEPAREWRYLRIPALVASLILAVAIVWYFWPLPPPKVLRITQLTNDGLTKYLYLATDGSRIYFTEQREGQPVIAQVPVTAGTVVPIPLELDRAYLPFLATFDFSPIRSELLISGGVGETPLWALSVPLGGRPRRLGDLLMYDASWSPDGQAIVYSKGNALYVAKADGSEGHKLASLEGPPFRVRWSPNGKLLRFSLETRTSSSWSLWEIAADGSNLHPLFPNWKTRDDCCGVWTADGRYFIFRSDRDGLGTVVALREKRWRTHPDASEVNELTAGPMSFVPFPSRNPKQIFARGTLRRGELMRYDRKLQRWGTYLPGISADGLDFSRDGEWVTYVTHPEAALWRSRVDGSHKLQLTILPMRAGLPRWSPDGKKIAFMGSRPGEPWKIYLVSADGGKSERLLPGEETEADPNWGPDGNHLVFGTGIEAEGRAVHVFDLRTRQITTLPASDGLFSPRWSPDGRYIATLTVTNPTRMFLFDLTKQTWKEWLTMPSSLSGWPTWSRDSKRIHFSCGEAFYQLRLGEHRPELIANVDVGSAMAGGLFAQWTGWAPHESPLFLRNASVAEIYALDLELP